MYAIFVPPRVLPALPLPRALSHFADAQGVEPTESKQDAKEVIPTSLILSAVFGLAITFFLILPNLPFTNADQL